MSHPNEVVITGVGVVSPIGIGRAAYWDSMLRGESGVGQISHYDTTNMPVTIGGEVGDFDPKQYVKPRKAVKVMSREIQLAVAAAQLAMDDAQLQRGGVDPDRLGVTMGGEMNYGEVGEMISVFDKCTEDHRFDFSRYGQEMMREIPPLWMLKYLPNMPACHIGIIHDARGPNNSLTLGDVSSLLAIGEALSVIRRGGADVMIAGGAGSRLNLMGKLWRGDFIVSHRNDAPQEAARPFDANRDGLVNSEGAATVILETRRHAEARGAKIRATVLGFASRFESGFRSEGLKGTATRQSIRGALKDAGRAAEEIGHVNANGLSTVEEDRLEAQAIRAELGDVPVAAPTSYFGHTGAGTGAVELTASLVAAAEGLIPPTRNYQTPDPACPVNVVADAPRPPEQPLYLKLNQQRNGQAAALLLGPP